MATVHPEKLYDILTDQPQLEMVVYFFSKNESGALKCWKDLFLTTLNECTGTCCSHSGRFWPLTRQRENDAARARARRLTVYVIPKQLIADIFGPFRRRRACARRAYCARKLGSQLFKTRLKNQFLVVADLTDFTYDSKSEIDSFSYRYTNHDLGNSVWESDKSANRESATIGIQHVNFNIFDVSPVKRS